MLTFDILDAGGQVSLDDYNLVIAGYTGRNIENVQHHIAELARIGVPSPTSIPSFYPLCPQLATQSALIDVSGMKTSGEVEPVLIATEEGNFLTVGSDHTDRELETLDIAAAKRACPKPVATSAIPVDDDFDWDEVTISSWADGVYYQEGSTKLLTPAPDLFGLSGARIPALLFAGTVPIANGEFSHATSWTVELALRDGRSVRHQYQVCVQDLEKAESGSQ